jgi:hypothetical protein
MRHQSEPEAKENTQGRHDTPKSASRAAQALDLTRIRTREIAKTALQLLKLG